MENLNAFLKRKNIVFSAKRYGIDALGAMAQGLFCSLLIGTILNTLGTQFHIGFLTAQIAEKVPYTVGGLTSFMSGPAMAIAIGYALQAPPLVLFSLASPCGGGAQCAHWAERVYIPLVDMTKDLCFYKVPVPVQNDSRSLKKHGSFLRLPAFCKKCWHEKYFCPCFWREME